MQTFMTLLRLPSGGQYAQKGLAVHFLSDPDEICCILPRTNINNGIACIAGSYKGFIRPSLIIAALKWLKRCNKFYSETEINELMFFNDFENETNAHEEFLNVCESGVVSIDYEFPDMHCRDLVTVRFPSIDKPLTSFFELKKYRSDGISMVVSNG